jgi:signal transduction histidine kinase
VNNQISVEKRKRATNPVYCFEGEIRQVLGNLIGNAIDSMPTGGRLILRSRDATSWNNGVMGVVLTVADTGTGMSKEVQKRIFDAFYTTKGIGGTGLGLWISSEIIAQHHGELSMRSSQIAGMSGTVFSLFLRSEQLPEASQIEKPHTYAADTRDLDAISSLIWVAGCLSLLLGAVLERIDS